MTTNIYLYEVYVCILKTVIDSPDKLNIKFKATLSSVGLVLHRSGRDMVCGHSPVCRQVCLSGLCLPQDVSDEETWELQSERELVSLHLKDINTSLSLLASGDMHVIALLGNCIMSDRRPDATALTQQMVSKIEEVTTPLLQLDYHLQYPEATRKVNQGKVLLPQ